MYSKEPEHKAQFTRKFDRVYSRFAHAYDLFVKWLPLWRSWLNQALPHIQGPRVLEVSFGTGYLLTRYAGKFETYGVDYNVDLIAVARQNLREHGLTTPLMRGNVEHLPFADNSFDSIVNTMAFSAYPDAVSAIREVHRVLKPGGRLVLMDVNYPRQAGWWGRFLIRGWMAMGDLVRDMDALLEQFHFTYTDQEIGGGGTVHLYLAEK